MSEVNGEIEFLTVKEVAERLHRGEEWVRENVVGFRWVGRQLLISKIAFKLWYDQQEMKAPPISSEELTIEVERRKVSEETTEPDPENGVA